MSSGAERRMYIRYSSPVLTVAMGGKQFKTVNWSLTGLLLTEVDAHVVEGLPGHFQAFGITISEADGQPVTKVEAQMTVVWYDPAKRLLALHTMGLTPTVADGMLRLLGARSID
ncbi:MAG: hypothetical protein SF002_18380 [Alphaproteobacteria bacterium]|nr:hypothetical protein [Alphaproteobacteria bacterium]